MTRSEYSTAAAIATECAGGVIRSAEPHSTTVGTAESTGSASVRS
ncbi:Uncharacterised protein [Mycobacteroides abscessus subsp. abscessus]|nr:Uncharacterised protein [Mycobacteroides abscessus subsp. abscessus]